jgi:hypothetical protein
MSDGEDSEASSQDQENLPPVSELAARKRRHVADDSAATAAAAPAQRPSRAKRPRLVFTPEDDKRITRKRDSMNRLSQRRREDSRRSTAPTQRRAAKTASHGGVDATFNGCICSHQQRHAR